MKKMQIGIIGSAGNEEYPQENQNREKTYLLAEETGKLIAENKAILITGGKGGIMSAAAKGAKKAGGITTGFISGKKRGLSNKETDVEIVSGMEGCGEETMLILSCDGLIAIGGGAGTLQELAIAYRNKKPVVVIDTNYGWSSSLKNKFLDERKKIKFVSTKSPKQAITLLLRMVK